MTGSRSWAEYARSNTRGGMRQGYDKYVDTNIFWCMNNNLILIADHDKIMKDEDVDADVGHEGVVVAEGGKSSLL